MKRNLLILSLIILFLSFIGLIYSANLSYVDSNGLVHDSAWMPISALSNLLGWILLIVSLVLYGIAFIKKRRKS